MRIVFIAEKKSNSLHKRMAGIPLVVSQPPLIAPVFIRIAIKG
jgi:hypothetical protein